MLPTYVPAEGYSWEIIDPQRNLKFFSSSVTFLLHCLFPVERNQRRLRNTRTNALNAKLQMSGRAMKSNFFGMALYIYLPWEKLTLCYFYFFSPFSNEKYRYCITVLISLKKKKKKAKCFLLEMLWPKMQWLGLHILASSNSSSMEYEKCHSE